MSGGLDQTAVEKLLANEKSNLEQCYQDALDSNPLLRGKVEVKIEVDGKGKVVKVSVSSADLSDTAFIDCLTKLIEAWLRKFDKVADAVAYLQSWRIMAAPVLSVTEIVEEDPQIKGREMLKEIEHRTLGPVKFLNTPLRFQNSQASVDAPPPAFVGEHTKDILSGLLKLNDEEIKELKSKGIVSRTDGEAPRGRPA